MSSLDHLRKQAKLYLRWHRQGYFPVAAQIGAVLPRFRFMADADILAANFQLRDAQELVARKCGFDSWPALIKGIDSMNPPARDPARTATILASEPQLFVSDLGAAFAFYVGRLGFEIAFAYGQPPFYGQVVRGGGRLNLRRAPGPVFDSGFQAREGDILSATLTVDDAKALFLEFQSAGAAFRQNLRREPWGARTFIISDPDGNLIAFAGD